MPLTMHSDVTGRIPETAFNKIIFEIMRQRPAIFNYATEAVINNNRYCSPIPVNPILDSMGIEKSTKVDKLSIIGSETTGGMDFCMQVKDLKLDFMPSSQIVIPAELGSLAAQEFALKGTICAGLACGQQIQVPGIQLGDIIQPIPRIKKRKIKTGLTFLPRLPMAMNCFCLSVFAKLIAVVENNELRLRLVGIEIKDIEPIGLENAIECYLKRILDETVFPKMKIGLSSLAFEVGDYFNVLPTPIIPATVPHNPDISNNNLSIYLNIN